MTISIKYNDITIKSC